MKFLSLNKTGEQKMAYQHEIKLGNMKRAFDLIRSGKCASRSDLAREMKLSATAISSLTDELIRRGLLIETGTIHADTPGRRPMNLKINNGEKQIAVFSLNRCKIHFTLYDLSFQVIEEHEFNREEAFDSSEDRGEAYISLFEDIIFRKSECVERERLLAVCISFPGFYLSHEHFFTAKTALDAVLKPDTLEDFIQRIGAPAFLANRFMCMAYAEKKLLSSRGIAADDLLYVNISDHVGSAIISEGVVYSGPNDTGGDISHVCVGTEGRPCACGGEDCLCHYLSLGALLQDVQAACRAENLPAPESFSALASLYGNHPVVDRVISSAAVRLARALSALIYITSTDRIVVTGGIRALGEKFLQAVSAELSRLIYARHHTLSFAQTDDNDDSIGIAQYLLDNTDVILSYDI